MKIYNSSTHNSSYYYLFSFLQALKFKILVKNKKVGTIEETMLRKGQDSHGETGEIFEEEYTSEEDETDEKAPLQQKSDSSKRKSENRLSSLPRKKAKVKNTHLDLI